jgi:hypothetical protein
VIDTEWVYAVWVLLSGIVISWGSSHWYRVIGNGPAGFTEHLGGKGTEIVVDESDIEREESHEEKHVSDWSEDSSHRFGVFLSEAQHGCKHEKDESMHDISEHDSEEEWEGNACENSRVYLLITWDTISVDNLLEYTRELIGLKESWFG